MKSKLVHLIPLSIMGVFPLLGWMYALVDGPNPKVYSVMTHWDQLIPFVRFFVLPYSIWIFYIYLCLIYFFVKDKKTYYRAIVSYIVCTLLCYCIYSVFQTTVPRPLITGNDIFSRLMIYIYRRDLPYNCFPSIHCFSCYLMAKAIYKSEFRNSLNQLLIYGMSTLIIVSTFLVKQHALLDAVAAFLLVELVYHAVYWIQAVYKVSLSKNRNQGIDF